MKQKFFSVCAFSLILLVCIALFFSGDYVVYLLAYIFSFVFLLFYTVMAASTIPGRNFGCKAAISLANSCDSSKAPRKADCIGVFLEKIVEIFIFALIMAAQIVFDVLVLRTLLEGDAEACRLGKLIGTLLIFVPFFLRRLLRKNGIKA